MDAAAVEDLFSSFGRVVVRRMFGGYGIYADGVMFAIEVGGEIYLKADAASEPLFREAKSSPFTYRKKDGRTTVMSYWRLPEEGLDDPDELARWARLALEAARRAKER